VAAVRFLIRVVMRQKAWVGFALLDFLYCTCLWGVSIESLGFSSKRRQDRPNRCFRSAGLDMRGVDR
jgi:hypothetical protein